LPAQPTFAINPAILKSSTQTLQSLVRSRQNNNLNAIRLLLAVLVVLDHSFPLAHGREDDPLSLLSNLQMPLGIIAVLLFFFISGFLITASWLNSKSMDDFLRRRILRIFPAYIVALIFSFLIASVFAAHPFADLPSRLGKFHDVFFLSYESCSGDWVFPHNVFPFTANGSLWTINREFMCYLLVAAIGLFGFFKYRFLFITAFLVMFGYFSLTVLLKGEAAIEFDRGFFTFLFFTLFLSGACAWLWRDKIPISPTLAISALLIALTTAQIPPWFMMLAPFAASYLVLWIGFASQIKILAWCDKTDLSYGVYLFAFPIQQALAFAGFTNPWAMFAVAAPVSMAVAFLSWTFVEKPFLQMKSRDFSDHDPCHGIPSKPPVPIADNAKTSW
jgi:peptidoglycan/LPS O-acetylase OafA/YrhL